MPDQVDLPALGSAYLQAKAQLDEVKARMKSAAIEASRIGVPDSTIATQLHVNRHTVRSWTDGAGA